MTGPFVKKPSFMVIPSLSCDAGCPYCFGPSEGGVMDLGTARETVGFMGSAARELGMEDASIVFHGGEPLIAPKAVWRELLEGVRQGLGWSRARLNVQSNPWNLDEEFAAGLFLKHRVSVGRAWTAPGSSPA